MTTKQAIRTALKDTNRFIIGDYNGQKWYCPDGSFATTDNIYDQYKRKKLQLADIGQFDHVANQPKMNTIIERDGNYIPVEQLNKSDGETSLYLQAGEHKVLVNKDYYLLMEALYPTATFEIDTAYKYSPVKIMVKDYVNGGNKLVAMIMPLHM